MHTVSGGGERVEVLIADDDPLARAMLRRALTEGGVAVVAEAASVPEMVALAERHSPDVVVMDSSLQVGDGSLRTLSDRVRGVRVLVMANAFDRDLALRALRAGASGYLTKDVDVGVLPRAVRAIVDGEAVISRKLTVDLIEWLRAAPELEIGTRPVKSILTPREWEVLDLMCLGHSTSSIAKELFVTPETVRTHVRNILRKLGVPSRQEAVASARLLRQRQAGDRAR
jgi:NarL family two-component system response regulator LiaR